MAKEFHLRSVAAVWEKLPGHDHASVTCRCEVLLQYSRSRSRDMSLCHFPSRTVSSCYTRSFTTPTRPSENFFSEHLEMNFGRHDDKFVPKIVLYDLNSISAHETRASFILFRPIFVIEILLLVEVKIWNPRTRFNEFLRTPKCFRPWVNKLQFTIFFTKTMFLDSIENRKRLDTAA